MMRRKYNKSRNRNKSRKKPKSKNNVVVIPKPKVKSFWKRIINASAIFGIIVALIAIGDFVKDHLTSQKEKWDVENTQTGKIQSQKISENYAPITVSANFYIDTTNKFPELKGIYIKNLHEMQSINIAIGHAIFVCPVTNLYKGVEILENAVQGCVSSSRLAVAAKEDRLYVSARFISLKDESLIGEMEFNHWKIYNGTFSDYTPGNDKFEVKDKQGNIVFSISYSDNTENAFVGISGYFISPDDVMVLNDKQAFKFFTGTNVLPKDCIQKSDPNWKVIAEKEIAKITSAF